MSVTDQTSGQTFANDSTVGTIAFSNPENVATSDDTYASAVLLLNEQTNYLKVTNFNLNVPIHSTIDGIIIAFERNATVLNSITDQRIRLVLPSGEISTTEKSTGAVWENTDSYIGFGSSTDTWGETLTPIMVNDRNFGVVMSAKATLLAGTANIDHVRVLIYYTQHSMPANYVRSVRAGESMSTNESAK
jgi:hypothetical protein